MANSWRHHYLPQFYIKGFCDLDGKIAVYDKATGRYNERVPKSIFYEKNRNTLVDETGQQSDILEDIYNTLETEISPSLTNVIRTNELSSKDLINLLFLAYLTKWRNPKYDNYFNYLKSEFTFDDLGVGVVAKKGNSLLNVSPELFFKSELSQEFKRTLFAIQPLLCLEDREVIFRESILVPSPPTYPALLGDFPFNEHLITYDRNFEDFVFPISTNCTLVYVKHIDKYDLRKFMENDKNETKTAAFYEKFSLARDIGTICLAKRYVGCSNSSYLKQMIEVYEKFFAHTPKKNSAGIFSILQNYANQ